MYIYLCGWMNGCVMGGLWILSVQLRFTIVSMAVNLLDYIIIQTVQSKAEWILSCCYANPACSHHQLFAVYTTIFWEQLTKWVFLKCTWLLGNQLGNTNMIISHFIHTVWAPATVLLNKAMYLTAFCAWYGSPHLPVTLVQLMRSGIGQNVSCAAGDFA